MTTLTQPSIEEDLERRAASGESDAFAELYERYCDRVHDFLCRMVGNDADAADLTQETFIRAMNAISLTQAGKASFSTWLFTIARNLGLNWIAKGRHSVPLEKDADADEERGAQWQIDEKRLADPAGAAEARELAQLVWSASNALEPKQRALLDLHVRQELDSAEIAMVLGVSKGSAYTMVSRLKDSFESAVAALMMFQLGRRKCPELDGLLRSARATELSPEVRRIVDRHSVVCEVCQGERGRLVSASAILRALALLVLPLALRRRVAEAAWAAHCEHERQQLAGGRSRLGRLFSRVDDGGGSKQVKRAAVVVAVVAAVVMAGSCAVATALGHEGGSSGAVAGLAVSPSPSRTIQPQAESAPAVLRTSTTGPTARPTNAPVPATSTPTAGASSPTALATRSVETATVTSLPTVATTPVEPTFVPSLTGVEDSCATFWARQPISGEGPNAEYTSIIVALQNRERALRSIRPMVESPQLASIAKEYARFFATARWWETHSGTALHIGPDGRDPGRRMVDAGIIGAGAEQTIAPIGSIWLAWSENVAWTPSTVGAGSWNPCEMHLHWSPQHVNNYLGVVDNVPHDNQYQGTSCYVIFASKTVGCVQDFVVFP
jgi:RNA polymerase sigma factor (sigma-70 family)